MRIVWRFLFLLALMVVPAAVDAQQITAAGQSKLFLRIDRYVVRRHRATALRLLRTVIAPQRWGIARAPHPGWTLHFKGGWGDYGEELAE